MHYVEAFSSAVASRVFSHQGELSSIEKYAAHRSFVDARDRWRYDALVVHAKALSRYPLAEAAFVRMLSGASGTQRIVLPRREVVVSMLERECAHEAYIVRLLFDIVGSDGSIDFTLRKGSTDDAVELVDGYRFDLVYAHEIPDGHVADAKFAVIDGHVASMSELDTLLSSSSKDGIPIVILARGYSDDVIRTVAYNRRRGSLRAFLLVAPMELERANDVFDIALVASCEARSPTKGQLISTMRFDELPFVERVEFSSGRVIVTNERSRQAVAAHTKLLRERLEASDVHNSQVLARRLRSLSSRRAVISLRDDLEYTHRALAVRLGCALVEHSTKWGIVEFDGKMVPRSSFEAVMEAHSAFSKTVVARSIVDFI